MNESKLQVENEKLKKKLGGLGAHVKEMYDELNGSIETEKMLHGVTHAELEKVKKLNEMLQKTNRDREDRLIEKTRRLGRLEDANEKAKEWFDTILSPGEGIKDRSLQIATQALQDMDEILGEKTDG